MKQAVIYIGEVTMTGLLCLFCFQMLFGAGEIQEYWKHIGGLVKIQKEHEVVSTMPQYLKNMTDTVWPQIRGCDRVYQVGENIEFSNTLLVKNEETGRWQPLSEQEEVLAELLEIRNSSGRVIAYEESGFLKGGDYKKQGLCFGQRGGYTLEVLLTGANGRHKRITYGVIVE